MTEGEVQQAEQRAATAKQILDQPMIREAFEELDARCWRAFKGLPVTDSEARESIALLLRAQQDFRSYFEALVEHGKTARLKFEHDNRKHNRA